MNPDDLCWIMRDFAQNTVKCMTEFVDDTSIYKNFPEIELTITEENTGCFGGVKIEGDHYIPCVELSIPYITGYTLDGFPEYPHIENDPEIGTVDVPISWQHTVTIVLSHEMAHAITLMHTLTKRHGLFVPRTYHAYSVDMIPQEYAIQKKLHGKNWQYVYRELRNKFANNWK